jgi:hypothetical protein
MEINITNEEYRLLIDVLYIADRVLQAHKINARPETDKYKNLIQKLFFYAKEMGFDNLVIYSKTLQGYYTTREYEQITEADDFIEAFENDCFWDQLIERLVKRDLIQKIGEYNLKSMDLEKRLQKEDLIRESYSEEFQKNGLNNISIESSKTL